MNDIDAEDEDLPYDDNGNPRLDGRRNTGNIHQAVTNSNNKNDALPWVAMACFLAGGCVLGLILMALLLPQIIDSKVAAGEARSQTAMADKAAEAKAIANAGREHARIALDKVEDFRAKLAAKGIDVPPLDGH